MSLERTGNAFHPASRWRRVRRVPVRFVAVDRYSPLAGAGAVVLWVVGAFLLEKDDRPEGKDTAQFVAWVEENDTAILVGAIMFAFGVLLFLWMLGSLRATLAAAEGGTARLASIAFGTGVATSACLMAFYTTKTSVG